MYYIDFLQTIIHYTHLSLTRVYDCQLLWCTNIYIVYCANFLDNTFLLLIPICLIYRVYLCGFMLQDCERTAKKRILERDCSVLSAHVFYMDFICMVYGLIGGCALFLYRLHLPKIIYRFFWIRKYYFFVFRACISNLIVSNQIKHF